MAICATLSCAALNRNQPIKASHKNCCHWLVLSANPLHRPSFHTDQLPLVPAIFDARVKILGNSQTIARKILPPSTGSPGANNVARIN